MEARQQTHKHTMEVWAETWTDMNSFCVHESWVVPKVSMVELWTNMDSIRVHAIHMASSLPAEHSAGPSNERASGSNRSVCTRVVDSVLLHAGGMMWR